jgi:hypothetical protein
VADYDPLFPQPHLRVEYVEQKKFCELALKSRFRPIEIVNDMSSMSWSFRIPSFAGRSDLSVVSGRMDRSADLVPGASGSPEKHPGLQPKTVKRHLSKSTSKKGKESSPAEPPVIPDELSDTQYQWDQRDPV